jgi:hypothetical protein
MAPCNPALKFVANGSPGSAFPPPLDPSDIPSTDTNPGFGDMASSFLDALDPATDGSDQIASDAAAAVDTLDTVGTAMDATLDSILVLLEQAQPQPVDNALGTFEGAQPGAEKFVGDAAGVPVPALAQVPIVGPGGADVVTLGNAPGQGGAAPSGAAPYVLHHPIPFAFDPTRLAGPAQLSGPNPPFVKLDGFHQDNPAKGLGGWVALIEINPAHAGSYSATLTFKLAITITGINTIVTYTVGITVLVQ